MYIYLGRCHLLGVNQHEIRTTGPFPDGRDNMKDWNHCQTNVAVALQIASNSSNHVGKTLEIQIENASNVEIVTDTEKTLQLTESTHKLSLEHENDKHSIVFIDEKMNIVEIYVQGDMPTISYKL